MKSIETYFQFVPHLYKMIIILCRLINTKENTNCFIYFRDD